MSCASVTLSITESLHLLFFSRQEISSGFWIANTLLYSFNSVVFVCVPFSETESNFFLILWMCFFFLLAAVKQTDSRWCSRTDGEKRGVGGFGGPPSKPL